MAAYQGSKRYASYTAALLFFIASALQGKSCKKCEDPLSNHTTVPFTQCLDVNNAGELNHDDDGSTINRIKDGKISIPLDTMCVIGGPGDSSHVRHCQRRSTTNNPIYPVSLTVGCVKDGTYYDHGGSYYGADGHYYGSGRTREDLDFRGIVDFEDEDACDICEYKVAAGRCVPNNDGTTCNVECDDDTTPSKVRVNCHDDGDRRLVDVMCRVSTMMRRSRSRWALAWASAFSRGFGAPGAQRLLRSGITQENKSPRRLAQSESGFVFEWNHGVAETHTSTPTESNFQSDDLPDELQMQLQQAGLTIHDSVVQNEIAFQIAQMQSSGQQSAEDSAVAPPEL